MGIKRDSAGGACVDAVCLTFDADWAPDWCLAECYRLCADHGAGATFFITDASPALVTIAADPAFELGIHPNFMPASTHGLSQADVVRHCLDLLQQYVKTGPASVSLRTHCLFQSSGLFAALSRLDVDFTDVSLFLPGMPARPFPFHITEEGREIWRVPYMWEDDLHALTPPPNTYCCNSMNSSNNKWICREKALQMPGVKIFNFHPVHVCLNMESMSRYEALKRFCPVSGATPEDVARLANPGRGTRTFLESLLAACPSAPMTIAALVAEARDA
jgi:hypothetical protein